MSDAQTRSEESRLSLDGRRRRDEIGTLLTRTARNRRTGRHAITAAAGIALLVIASFSVRTLVPGRAAPKQITYTPEPSRPAPIPAQPAIQIAVFSNEPLPDRPCSELAPAAASSSAGLPVCILDDAHLLRALAQTGESYGIVRIGGRVEVVRNVR